MSDIGLYQILILISFTIGYLFITIEHITHVNKTSVALFMAIICWLFQFLNQTHSNETNVHFLCEHLADISQVIFFLLGALTIVEIISAHRGFQLISKYIRVRSKRKLLWLIAFISFFLSSILDNLTTTIIMITLLRKLTEKGEERLLMGGAVVIAANAGGAWTPIGDVTTTMLWIGGHLSSLQIIKTLFLPSLVCMIAALFILQFSLKGEFNFDETIEEPKIEPLGAIIFWLGISCLVFVPIFKVLTGLPPFMGMILGMSVMWLFTDLIHTRHDNREYLKVPYIMTRIDISGVLFFLGILLSVGALYTSGLLGNLANWLDSTIAHSEIIAITLGLISAVIDNVPLVAAVTGMYDLSQYPMNSSFWSLVAYCAGTGGSILIIGSAAGVAFMGLERVDFFAYMRRVGLAALVGYFAGIGVFKLFEM